MRRSSILIVVLTLVFTAFAGYLAGAAGSGAGAGSGGHQISTPAFSRVVFLSHPNNPARIPVFPGDPAFRLSTAFTVKNDGFYLQYVQEGEHTGTHYSAPCHFHVHGLCAAQLDPGDFILPAVVLDVRNKVAHNVDYHVTVADLKAWHNAHGPLPHDPNLLQLRQRRRTVPPAGLLVARGEVADRARCPGRARCAGHRHVRAGSRRRSELPRDVAHASPSPLHAREPHEPRCDADERRVDRDRRSAEPTRLGSAEHDLRPDVVAARRGLVATRSACGTSAWAASSWLARRSP